MWRTKGREFSELYFFEVRGRDKSCLSIPLNIIRCPARRCLSKQETRRGHLYHCDVGNDETNSAFAGQRLGALRDDLGFATPVSVLHRHDDPLGAD